MKIKDWLLFEKNDLDKRIRSYPRFRLWLLLSSAFGFIVSLLWLWTKTSSLKIEAFDRELMVLVSQIKTPFLIDFFGLVTFIGSLAFMALSVLFLAFVLILRKRKKAAAVAIFSTLGSIFFIFFFKIIFSRARPTGCLDNGDCWAFPSGHATLAFYFYGLLDYLIWRFLPISLKTFLVTSFWIVLLVILIALSRLFLNVHYPSDLLGGFFLGGAWLLLTIFLIDILYSKS